jgi:uncharacterized membrane protein YbhN (UPF0104 family)
MRKFALIVLKLAISASLLYFATRNLNFGAVSARFSRVDPSWLLMALAIALLQNVLIALRWHRVIEICGAAVAPMKAIRFNLIGSFFSQVLPATIGGDAARIVLLARQGAGWWKATCSVLLDRFVGLLVLALLVTAALPWSLQLIGNPIGRVGLLVIGLGSIAGAVFFLALAYVPMLRQWKWTAKLADLSGLASQCLFSGRASAFIMASSALSHVMLAAITWCAGKSVSAHLEFSQAFLLSLPVNLISTAPISIAGWGVRESVMVLAFSYAGLSEGDAFIVSILVGLVTLATGILGGIVWLLNPEKIAED